MSQEGYKGAYTVGVSQEGYKGMYTVGVHVSQEGCNHSQDGYKGVGVSQKGIRVCTL